MIGLAVGEWLEAASNGFQLITHDWLEAASNGFQPITQPTKIKKSVSGFERFPTIRNYLQKNRGGGSLGV